VKDCKHTNCLHYRGTRIEYAPGVESPSIDRNARTGEPIRSVLVDARICQCGAWLSLGPARDTAETAIEVRAAGLAAGAERHRCESCGILAYVDDLTHQPSVTMGHRRDPSWHSGWLAAAMLDEVAK
jgi:hypothetical protein